MQTLQELIGYCRCLAAVAVAAVVLDGALVQSWPRLRHHALG